MKNRTAHLGRRNLLHDHPLIEKGWDVREIHQTHVQNGASEPEA